MTPIEQKLRAYPSVGRGVMRFRLVYNGVLPASANSSKPLDVMRIRKELSPQLKYLWETHSALKVLLNEGARKLPSNNFNQFAGSPSPRQLSRIMPEEYEDLCVEIPVGDKHYMPLVRKSLDLNCELNILFLRQQDPGDLVSQGGDIDNRIKTLLDALRMPDRAEQEKAPYQERGLYCLMESDTLVSRLDIDTDRLLFPVTTKPHEVHLVIEVKINVLRVAIHNMCLL